MKITRLERNADSHSSGMDIVHAAQDMFHRSAISKIASAECCFGTSHLRFLKVVVICDVFTRQACS